MSATCYMCAADAGSREHAPPLCLFPETKDLPPGSDDLRRNLITVPSCEDHNPRTSMDDEYFFVVVASMLQGNDRSTRQFSTKVIRALTRSPSFTRRVFSETMPAVIDGQPSIGFSVDGKRIERIVDKIVRAIFFAHTNGEKTLGPIRVLMPAFHHGSSSANAAFARLRPLAELFFTNTQATWHGANPAVFCYRIHADALEQASFLELRFYGGIDFLAVWGSQFAEVAVTD